MGEVVRPRQHPAVGHVSESGKDGGARLLARDKSAVFRRFLQQNEQQLSLPILLGDSFGIFLSGTLQKCFRLEPAK